MTKKMCSFLILGVILVFSIAAQDLSPSARKPTADGILGADEYSFNGTYSGMKLGVSLSADRATLYLALEAPTTGWVALGLGSLTMNGAYIVLASVTNGQPVVSEQTGAGHGHSPNKEKKLAASAVRETNGTTVLEIALPAAAYASGNTMQILMSYGAADSFVVKHSVHASAELSVAK